MSQMQQLYVEKKKTITAEELMNMVGVSRSLPGTMIGNVAVLYGYHEAGAIGALICLFSMVLASIILLIGISLCYDAFRTNYWVNAAMEGVQAAVVPIIACAVLGLMKGSIKNWVSVVIMAACAIMYFVFDIPVIWLIAFGIVCGLICGEISSRREADTNGAS